MRTFIIFAAICGSFIAIHGDDVEMVEHEDPPNGPAATINENQEHVESSTDHVQGQEVRSEMPMEPATELLPPFLPAQEWSSNATESSLQQPPTHHLAPDAEPALVRQEAEQPQERPIERYSETNSSEPLLPPLYPLPPSVPDSPVNPMPYVPTNGSAPPGTPPNNSSYVSPVVPAPAVPAPVYPSPAVPAPAYPAPAVPAPAVPSPVAPPQVVSVYSTTTSPNVTTRKPRRSNSYVTMKQWNDLIRRLRSYMTRSNREKRASAYPPPARNQNNRRARTGRNRPN